MESGSPAFIQLDIFVLISSKQTKDYFAEHRAEILAQARTDLEAGRYDSVIAIAKKYVIVGDTELKQLGEDAEQDKKQQQIETLRREIAQTSELNIKETKLKELLALVPNDSDATRQLGEVVNLNKQQRIESLGNEIANISDLKTKESSAEPKKEKYIPDLTAVDVHGNFTNKGFDLTKDFGSEQTVWRCIKKTPGNQGMVEVFGRFPTQITMVRGTYNNYSDDDTNQDPLELLAYLASIQYGGSQPKTASSWVKNNIGKNATITIGGATLELIARVPTSRMLIIQPARHTEPELQTPQQLNSPNTEPSPEEQTKKNEKAAAAKLRLAQQFIDKGENSIARDWLSKLIKEFPDTKAAKEAKEKLDALK